MDIAYNLEAQQLKRKDRITQNASMVSLVIYLPHIFCMSCVRQREEVNLIWSTPFSDNLKAVHASKS